MYGVSKRFAFPLLVFHRVAPIPYVQAAKAIFCAYYLWAAIMFFSSHKVEVALLMTYTPNTKCMSHSHPQPAVEHIHEGSCFHPSQHCCGHKGYLPDCQPINTPSHPPKQTHGRLLLLAGIKL